MSLTVQFSYKIYISRSLITYITTAALTRSNCEEIFQFSAGQSFSIGNDNTFACIKFF